MKRILFWGLALALILGMAMPAMALDELEMTEFYAYDDAESQGLVVLFDALLIRPFGVAACMVGAIGGIASVPAAMTHHSNPKLVTDELILKPWNYTFRRPLGEFEWPERHLVFRHD